MAVLPSSPTTYKLAVRPNQKMKETLVQLIERQIAEIGCFSSANEPIQANN
jgi:hypothetical protein